MLNAFANSSQSMLEGIPELANKYGPNTDFLDAFMSEFWNAFKYRLRAVGEAVNMLSIFPPLTYQEAIRKPACRQHLGTRYHFAAADTSPAWKVRARLHYCRRPTQWFPSHP